MRGTILNEKRAIGINTWRRAASRGYYVEHLNDDSVHYDIVIQFISSQDIDIGGRPRWIWGVWGDLHSPDSQQLRGQDAYY